MENPTRNILKSIILVIPLFSRLSLTTFVSIDCGNLESNITDPQTNITWTSDNDDDYIIQQGNSHNVSLGIGTLRTLRAFPTLKNKKKKHCYSIGVEDGEKVLTRASFFYGNYDNLSSPPTFDLMFDGNYWASVNTSTSNNQVLDYEAVYVTKGNYTDICVAHDDESKNNSSNNNIPFISSIELRSLNPSMYNNVDPNYALILLSRRAFGANQDLRYPDDMFDRIWRSKHSGNDLIYAVKSNAFDINTSTVQDQPPEAAMRNAFTVPNTSYQIQFEISSLLPPTNTNNNDDDDTISLYINTYFSEVKNNTFGKRSIRIHKGNIGALSTGPIFPPFGSVEEVHVNMQISSSSSSSSSLYFQATHDSALPVIVNAVEVYRIQPLADGTDTRDVEGLKKLQLAFNQTLMEWKGDPCLPIPYSWEWIKCTNDDSKPRVKELNLSGNNLHGVLPDFRSMDALEIIDLHNNSIEGSVPEFLGFFPLLRVLNLSYNGFNGSIPTSLNNTDIAIDTRNNTDLVQMHFQQDINNNSTTSVNDAPKMMIPLKLRVLMFQAAIQILYYLCYG